MMDAATAEIVGRTAAAWSRRYPALDVRDLAQEAWLAACTARRRWDARRRWAPYVQVALGYALGWYATASLAPVSGHHRRAHLVGIGRAEIDESIEAAGDPEAATATAQIRARVHAVVRAGRDGDMAEAILLGGGTVRGVMRARRVPRRRVTTALAAARARVAGDTALAAAWAAV